MYNILKELFPINRSITGPGVRQTLKYLKKYLPGLNIKHIKSGTEVFDWKVPQEWIIKEAYLLDENGNKIVDFKKSNLHVIGHSIFVNKWFSYKNIKKHLYYLKKQPNAIPYTTSYFHKKWGFCISYNNFKKLSKKKKYYAYIDSTFKDGHLNYGEIFIKGQSKKEILLSSYICHPSLADNELSGPVVLLSLTQWLLRQKKLYYSYRIVLAPETLGAICYIKENFDNLKRNCVGGYILTCLGNNGNFSIVPSKYDNTFSDHVAKTVLKNKKIKFKKYSFLERGSDERQYCSANVNLPISSVMRSKYATRKEYHTSLDDLNYVSETNLNKSLRVYKSIIKYIENSRLPLAQYKCEPFLSKKNLYPKIGSKPKIPHNKFYRGGFKALMNFLTYSDGKNSLEQIAKYCGLSVTKCQRLAKLAIKNKLIKFL